MHDLLNMSLHDKGDTLEILVIHLRPAKEQQALGSFFSEDQIAQARSSI